MGRETDTQRLTASSIRPPLPLAPVDVLGGREDERTRGQEATKRLCISSTFSGCHICVSPASSSPLLISVSLFRLRCGTLLGALRCLVFAWIKPTRGREGQTTLHSSDRNPGRKGPQLHTCPVPPFPRFRLALLHFMFMCS